MTFMSKRGPVPERLKHRRAFELWLSLGGNKTFAIMEKVAASEDVTTRTIYNWAKKYNWITRREVREGQVSEIMQEQGKLAMIDMRRKYRATTQKAIRQFEAHLDAGEVPLISVAEYRDLVKLDLLLAGDESVRKDTTINIITAIPRPEHRLSGEVIDAEAIEALSVPDKTGE